MIVEETLTAVRFLWCVMVAFWVSVTAMIVGAMWLSRKGRQR